MLRKITRAEIEKEINIP